MAPPPATWQQPQQPAPGASYNPAAAPPLGGQQWDASAPPTWDPSAQQAWGAPAPVPEASSKGGSSVLGGVVALIGAILTLVGVFSGWVKLDSTGTVTGWSLTTGDGLLKTSTPYVIVGLAAIAIVLAFLLFAGVARPLVRIVTILVGLAIVGVTVANWMEIASFVTDNFPSSFKASGAIGFYLAIAGGVVTAIAGLLPAKKK